MNISQFLHEETTEKNKLNYNDEDRWTSDTLAEHLALPSDSLFELLDLLIHSGLLVETNDTPPAYMPAHDPASISLDQILTIMHRAGEADYVLQEQTLEHEPVKRLLENMEGSFKQSLAGRSLKDLVD